MRFGAIVAPPDKGCRHRERFYVIAGGTGSARPARRQLTEALGVQSIRRLPGAVINRYVRQRLIDGVGGVIGLMASASDDVVKDIVLWVIGMSDGKDCVDGEERPRILGSPSGGSPFAMGGGLGGRCGLGTYVGRDRIDGPRQPHRIEGQPVILAADGTSRVVVIGVDGVRTKSSLDHDIRHNAGPDCFCNMLGVGGLARRNMDDMAGQLHHMLEHIDWQSDRFS